MNNVYNVMIKRDGDWWIGWVEEAPGVNCREATREELLESLRVTLQRGVGFQLTRSYNEISHILANKICKDLGVPPVK